MYSRPGCHLCDEMAAIVARVTPTIDTPVTVTHVDISGDAELESRYGLEVPVLLVNGTKAAKYRVTEADLRRMLVGRAG
jgi:hypothetical protein